MFNYCPDEVNVLIAGIFPVKGFVDGTFVEVTKDVVPFSSHRTSDGVVSRVYNRDQTYTIRLTITSASQSNDVLTKFWQLDEISQKGKFPLIIKDVSGTDLFFSTTTWIEEPPSIVKSQTVDERTWILRSTQAFVNIGGNEEASGIIGDLVNIAISAVPALEGIL